jgi:hypothetical protein
MQFSYFKIDDVSFSNGDTSTVVACYGRVLALVRSLFLSKKLFLNYLDKDLGPEDIFTEPIIVLD